MHAIVCARHIYVVGQDAAPTHAALTRVEEPKAAKGTKRAAAKALDDSDDDWFDAVPRGSARRKIARTSGGPCCIACVRFRSSHVVPSFAVLFVLHTYSCFLNVVAACDCAAQAVVVVMAVTALDPGVAAAAATALAPVVLLLAALGAALRGATASTKAKHCKDRTCYSCISHVSTAPQLKYFFVDLRQHVQIH
jgi:hypothetical protein